MNNMMVANILGFPITFELIAFIVSVVLTLVLLLMLLIGVAGSSKRERKYIKKASEKNAKIPVKVTIPLPGSGEFISAEMRPVERITGNVQDSGPVDSSTEIMPAAEMNKNFGKTGIISQSDVLRFSQDENVPAAVGANAVQMSGTQSKSNTFSAPLGFGSMTETIDKPSDERICSKCGNKVTGKFCARCGTKYE